MSNQNQALVGLVSTCGCEYMIVKLQTWVTTVLHFLVLELFLSNQALVAKLPAQTGHDRKLKCM